MTRIARLSLTLAAAAALALPAAAQADNTLSITQGDAVFRSEDPGMNNQFVIEDRGTNVRFYEPVDPYGINASDPRCAPGETKGQYVIEWFCPKSIVNRSITLEAGPGEDTATYNVAGVPGTLAGETGADKITSLSNTNDFLTGDQGNDTLDAGPGDDELRGEDGADTMIAGDGNDKLFGGGSEDTLDAGNGDDQIQTPDGLVDKVACGPGNDSIVADTIDDLTDCENATRQFVAPPAEGSGTANDTTRPVCKVGASTRQRVTKKRRWLRIAVTSSEKGEVAAGGFLRAGGVNNPIKPVRGTIGVAGGGLELKLKLTKRLVRVAKRAFKRKKRPWVRVTISSVDAAGNTSRPRHLRIYVR